MGYFILLSGGLEPGKHFPLNASTEKVSGVGLGIREAVYQSSLTCPLTVKIVNEIVTMIVVGHYAGTACVFWWPEDILPAV
jgi:hypothetical protein